MAAPLVALIMGSDSDLPTVQEACAVLRDFGVPFEVRVLSAHRCPEDLVAFVKHHYLRDESNKYRPFSHCTATIAYSP